MDMRSRNQGRGSALPQVPSSAEDSCEGTEEGARRTHSGRFQEDGRCLRPDQSLLAKISDQRRRDAPSPSPGLH
ncbi:unnamed protein product [Caretta caretta]